MFKKPKKRMIIRFNNENVPLLNQRGENEKAKNVQI
jgi:hypothetical protein